MNAPEGTEPGELPVTEAQRRIVDALRESGGEGSAAEVAALLGLHVTTVRFHLDRLRDLGVVTSRTETPSGRGRPRTRYRLAGADSVRAMSAMIEALAGLVDAGPKPGERAERAGRRWGERIELPDGDPLEVMESVLAELGFDPVEDPRGLVLRGCPFREAARVHRGTVCRLHLGLLRAVAERTGASAQAIELSPFVTTTECVVSVNGES